MEQYLCKNCNKSKNLHLAVTFNCPVPSRFRSFKEYSVDKIYTPNYTKPIPVQKYTI